MTCNTGIWQCFCLVTTHCVRSSGNTFDSNVNWNKSISCWILLYMHMADLYPGSQRLPRVSEGWREDEGGSGCWRLASHWRRGTVAAGETSSSRRIAHFKLDLLLPQITLKSIHDLAILQSQNLVQNQTVSALSAAQFLDLFPQFFCKMLTWEEGEQY